MSRAGRKSTVDVPPLPVTTQQSMGETVAARRSARNKSVADTTPTTPTFVSTETSAKRKRSTKDTPASKKTKKASNNKSATAAMNTPLKSKPAKARKHGAIQVNVDMPEEDPYIASPPPSVSNDIISAREHTEPDIDSSGPEDNDDGHGIIENEREHDRQAVHSFEMEAAHFCSSLSENYVPRIRSSSLDLSSSPYTSPASDFNDNSVVEQSPPLQQVTQEVARKLEYELPRITNENLPTSKNIPVPVLVNKTRLTTTLPATVPLVGPTWRDRTTIAVHCKGTSGHTWILSKSGQSTTMQGVIERAIKEGKAELLTGHKYCPLDSEEVKQLAISSLIKAAEQLGYEGEHDVADRLEHGEHDTYIKPLTAYVASRIGNEWAKELKGIGLSAVVVNAYGLNNFGGTMTAAQIILTKHFMYGLDPNGNFNNLKPFQHRAYIAYVQGTFFGTGLYGTVIRGCQGRFTSSNQSKPLELELTKGMVALATAGIHALLNDYSRGGHPASFPATESAAIWRTAISTLENIERVNRVLYHKIMHELYMATPGALPLAQHGWSQQQILDTTDWAALAADNVDTSPAAPAASTT
ncbi:uncharacterized protein C8R40DRAFT_1169834 [Lentinula edodes]|uniref:uncharacterized protein n=1 Tax=Lentinula edodes TaxID=5353 RepID=UPI001E8CAEFD|nr:uncharacterized protein C8R40DRAFT_1169834 [Lentinula edodes]KAH7876172.1 hypothetical protein C8R40DRAFT_1169834 [Lentinula edodes]